MHEKTSHDVEREIIPTLLKVLVLFIPSESKSSFNLNVTHLFHSRYIPSYWSTNYLQIRFSWYKSDAILQNSELQLWFSLQFTFSSKNLNELRDFMTQIFKHRLNFLTKSWLISLFHFDSNRSGLIEHVGLKEH